MRLDNYMRQYQDQLPVLGSERQNKLRVTKVLVGGFGSVGSHLAVFLNMLGVCEIVAIDPQKLELSNLNRWPCGTEAEVGLRKIDAAARFFARTPQVGFSGLPVKTESPETDHLYGQCDYVFSCANTISARIAVARKAIRYKKAVFDVSVSDGSKPPRGVVKYWLPQNAAWSACPECYLETRPSKKKDKGLLLTPIAATAASAAHVFLAVATGYSGSFYQRRNLLVFDLEQWQTVSFAVKKRDNCRACGRV